MPSDGERLWAALRSQGLGLICGFATVTLLAVGSIVLAATRDGASAGVALDEIRGFFSPWASAHLWFYLLVPVLGLYGLNTVLCTWHNVVGRWRRGVRRPSAYAPAVMHLAFVVALLAHLVSGLGSAEQRPQVLGSRWAALEGTGDVARLLTLQVDRHPDRSPRQVRARLELRDRTGKTRQETIAYNQPLSRTLGSELLLLARFGWEHGVRLSVGARWCTARVEESCALERLTLKVLSLHAAGHWGSGLLIRLALSFGEGTGEVTLLQGRPLRLPDGRLLQVEGLVRQPWIALRSRRTPGNPWALGSALLLALGVVMMGRRWF